MRLSDNLRRKRKVRYKYLVAITQRRYAEQYREFFPSVGVNTVLTKLCHGTAQKKHLDLLGIEDTDKIMFESIVDRELIPEIKRGLKLNMDIGTSGNGIAFTIPLDGIGGKSALKYFTGSVPEVIKEEEGMSEVENKFVLIVTVVDKGNTETVMDAAREAGATGGTVTKAHGTGADIAKFFGVSISEEKEMVYIVAKKEIRDNIMRAIMDKAGSKTEAHGVVFSLPVDSVMGIASFENI